MPLRSVKLTATEAATLRELTRRFGTSELASKAARNAVKARCARLAGPVGKREIAVLCKNENRIDVLTREEYMSSRDQNLWDCG